MFHAKNGQLKLEETSVDYIRFGTGEKYLILIPGVGDGLRTVRGSALPFSFLYRMFAKEYTVFAFSRKNNLPETYTTEQMADDLSQCMDQLQIPKADLVGVSQGGMIALHLALRYPQKVGKLVLVVTLARQNPIIQQAVTHWIDLVSAQRYRELFLDIAKKSYSPPYLKRALPLYSLLARAMKPKNPQRFLTMARSCLTHDCYLQLQQIACPTLIIAGGRDQIVGADASREIASQIVGSQLYIYEDLGHGLYEEAKDFSQRILSFLTSSIQGGSL